MPRHRLVPMALLATLGATAGVQTSAQALTTPPSVAGVVQVSTVAAPVRAQGEHRVQPGDTLSHIAVANGTTVAALRSANGLSGTQIRVGQQLVIPGGGARGSGGPASGGGNVTVRAGDTVSGIAKARGTTTAAILAANPGLDPRALRVGQKIVVPAGSSAPRSSPAGGSPAPVPNTFAGRTYPEATVRAANANKQALHARSVPSTGQMRSIIADTARRHGVDPALAQAVAHQESGFNMRAVSPANAVGAMQVIPSSGQWASRMAGRTLDLMDPHDNATAGVLILRAHQRAGVSEEIVIASYYQGRGSVTRNGMYPDTRRYVANVQNLKSRY